LVEAEDGNFYGASDAHDHVGAIFRVTRDGALTTVVHFDSSNGEHPVGLIQARDGNFYGLCYSWGTHCCPPVGTAFKMAPSGALTTLFSFTGYGGDYPGAYPWAGLTEGVDGNLYGTTSSGGVIGAGNIFRIIMPGPLLSLNAQPSGSNQVVLSWRTNFTGFTLQSAGDPMSTNWFDCATTPAISGGRFFITNGMSSGAQFFRLKK